MKLAGARSEEEAARRRNARRRVARKRRKNLRGLFRAAYHEASHAVATYLRMLAGRTDRVTVVPDRADAKPWRAAGLHYRAARIPAVAGRHVDHAALADEFVVLFAGVVGEERYTGRKRGGGSGDLAIARQLDADARLSDMRDQVRELGRANAQPLTIEDLAPLTRSITAERERAFRAYRSQARRLARDHWPEIRAVAHALLEHGELTGDQVREVIEATQQKLEARKRPGRR